MRANTFLDSWYSPRVNPLLIPLAWLFFLIITFRRFLYRLGFLKSYKLPVPVIVVGNITLGGTGKTPLVMALCQWFRTRGYHPGIVSRGYGGNVKHSHLLNEKDSAMTVGDEPWLMFQTLQCPIVVGKDRHRAATELLHKHPEVDVLILDDGLQHYRLQRDVELVVIDGLRQLGNGYLIPAGPLREPRSRLASVDLVVVNGDQQKKPYHSRQFTMHLVPQYWLKVGDPKTQLSLDAFQNQQVSAVCAIGHPQRFFRTLQELGVGVQNTRVFEDHHPYQKSDFIGLEEEKVLMTEKDGIKCQHIAPQDSWMLHVEAQLDLSIFDWLGSRFTHKE